MKKWTDISDIKGGRIEQAKVEAQRQIAEELHELNGYFKEINATLKKVRDGQLFVTTKAL